MSEKALTERFIAMFRCDTARISKPNGTLFLIIGRKRHTKDDPGQWVRNGQPYDFEYTHEEVIASGANEAELIASAKLYKRLSGMTWEQVFAEPGLIQKLCPA